MKHPKEYKISRGAEYLTTLVSVSLLLLIIGAVALLAIAADRETRRLKGNIELSLIMADSVGDARCALLADSLRRLPCARQVSCISSAEAMKAWQQQTGENLQAVFGVNPLSPEIALTLRPDHTSPDSLKAIEARLRKLPGVEEVAMPDARMVEDMNRTIGHIMWGLGTLALVMVAISFVLINNTVHLGIYSRRFAIHTMQLVGATDSFVRRPLLAGNTLTGVLAGLIASALLAAALASGPALANAPLTLWVPWSCALPVFAALTAAGALICLLAAFIASTRWLRKDYDSLFK